MNEHTLNELLDFHADVYCQASRIARGINEHDLGLNHAYFRKCGRVGKCNEVIKFSAPTLSSLLAEVWLNLCEKNAFVIH